MISIMLFSQWTLKKKCESFNFTFICNKTENRTIINVNTICPLYFELYRFIDKSVTHFHIFEHLKLNGAFK